MDTIRNVLQVLQRALNQSFQNASAREEDWVVLSSFVDSRRAPCEICRDRVVLSLYNITKEAATNMPAAAPPGAESGAVLPPPLYLDLHIVFMANFSGASYPEGLAAISRVVAFLQETPFFDHAGAPDLDPALDRFALSFVNLSPGEISHVLGALGAPYLPCAFFLLRLLPFASTAALARSYPARGAALAGNPATGRAA